jgi:hypothetical protein
LLPGQYIGSRRELPRYGAPEGDPARGPDDGGRGAGRRQRNRRDKMRDVGLGQAVPPFAPGHRAAASMTPKSPACFRTSAIARPQAEAGRPNRSAARCLAFSACSSRLRGEALVSSRLMRRHATSNTSVYRVAKGGLIDLGGRVEAAQFAYELERGGADLIMGRRRIEIEQCLDAAAHDPVPSNRFGITPCSRTSSTSWARGPARPMSRRGRRA